MFIIDKRELDKHPDIPQLLKTPFDIGTLDAGDYAFISRNLTTWGVERATIPDLIGKLYEGRLENQLEKCSQMYNTVVLLVEGVYDSLGGCVMTHKKTEKGYLREKAYAFTLYTSLQALFGRLSMLGVLILPSANFPCSMASLDALYGISNSTDSRLFRGRKVRIKTKLSNNPTVPKLMAICDRMPEVVAVALVEKYETIWTILNTPDKELLKINGLGKTLLDRLHISIGK